MPKLLGPLTALLVVIALALAACGDDEDEPSEPPVAEAPCEEAETPAPREVDLDPPPSEPSSDDVSIVFDTSCGEFTVALDTQGNPKTAASFEYLAENGVFDDSLFHRIVPGFVIQAGDPATTGAGPGPGYSVDEKPPSDFTYTEGVVAMAKTEAEPPGRSGSQFFVVTAADAGLPPDYAVVGEVTEGIEVAKTIEAPPYGDPNGGGMPGDVVVINSATVETG